MFLERVLFNILSEGITRWTSNRKLLKEFFLDGGLTDDEAGKAADILIAEPPNPLHGYARSGSQFPAWAITLGSESTSQDYLGEEASNTAEPDFVGGEQEGEVYLDDDGNRINQKARRWQNVFDLFIYTNHPDVTLYHYHLCKRICSESQMDLMEGGLEQVVYSGADLAPDPRYMPPGLYVRRFTISCQSDQNWPTRLGVGDGARVSASQQDDGQSVTGGETFGITAYEE
jgi:hypothetical protein